MTRNRILRYVALGAVLVLLLLLLWTWPSRRQPQSAAPLPAETPDTPVAQAMPQRTAPLAGPTIAVALPSAPALAVESTAAAAESPSTISGHVFTKEPLRGAAGVRVRLLEERVGEQAAETAVAVTDASGCFRLGGLKAGARYTLTPSVPTGYTEPASEAFVFDPARSGEPHVFFWNPEVGTIAGTLTDVTPDYSQVDFDAFVQALVAMDEGRMKEDDERMKAALRGLAPRPVPNALVTLRGESLLKQATTDSQGRFECPDLPFGEYEVSAEAPLWMLAAPGARTQPARKSVKLRDTRAKVELALRADLVLVKGRITDDRGRPVFGAKVAIVYDPAIEFSMDRDDGQGRARWMDASNRSTLSDAAGYYELPAPEPKQILEWCLPGNPGTPGYFGVSVEANGLVQREEDMRRLLTFSDAQLAALRRFLKAILPVMPQTGARTAQEFEEGLKKWLGPLPVNHGDGTLTVDIVLHPAGTPGP